MKTKVIGKCVICGFETERGMHHGKRYGPYKKTCSVKCTTIHRNNLVKIMHLGVEKNKDIIYKKRSERMKVNNPMWMDGVKEKAMATNKRLGTKPTIRGGNGREMPVPQRVLLTALGEGWYAEHAVPTKELKINKKYPTCYKIDIANPKLMIGVEVDGGSHCTLERQRQDKKKEELLITLGWAILRFKNEEVMKNLLKVLQAIYAKVV